MKRSLSGQIAAVFLGLIALVLALFFLFNNTLMERYYVMRQQNNLVKVYQMLDEHITEDGIDEDYFQGEFREISSTNNITLVVLDENYESVLEEFEDGRPWNNDSVMAARLFGYGTGIDTDQVTILKKTDNYTIQKKEDGKMGMDYLEIWGTLTAGYHFIMRIPMASIRSSVHITNEFTMYVGILVIVLSIFMALWTSRKIARPIRELTDLSKRMADLDFEAKYTSGGKNEIGQLGEHFNKMSETLEQTISQLKTANNELQQDIEKKIQIDEMRKEFLSNVSHELKTPLALIQGYAEGLQECINDDEESRNFYCEVIMDEASKMNEMVKKLLTLNQLEFGNDHIDMERFDLTQLIEGKLQSIGILADQKEARLVCDIHEPLYVWGDEFKVEEVLTNYLSNALNHVDGQRIIRVSALRRENKIRVFVFNTGSQIPEEDLSQIWVKFYKVDKARTREYGGSGVGLSIVKAIMDSFHQHYGVINEEDGVEFWFELELADGHA